MSNYEEIGEVHKGNMTYEILERKSLMTSNDYVVRDKDTGKTTGRICSREDAYRWIEDR
jgi:hypothetical protein